MCTALEATWGAGYAACTNSSFRHSPTNAQLQVSEMVHFDFNSEEMLFSTLQPHLSGIDPLSRCTNMLFNLSQRSEHYFLVVIVERLYGSDDDSSYAAPAKILKNPKARAELVQVSTMFLFLLNPLSVVFNFSFWFFCSVLLRIRQNTVI